MKRIQRELQRAFPFARIERTAGGHMRIRLPTGHIIYKSSTPSCWRSGRNLRAYIRRQLKPRAAGSAHSEEC